MRARCWAARLLGGLSLALAGLAQAASACPPVAQPLDEAAVRQGLRDARDHGFLWRIEQDGRSSWLYGTLHVAELSWMFPARSVMDALRSADRVALELDLMDPDISRRLQVAMQAPPGAPALPPALAKRLAAQSQAACVGNALASLRPEMQAMTLLALAGRSQRLDPAYGIDGFLAGFARGLGKPVTSLETPEAQLALLLQDDPAAMQRQVSDTLDELEKGSGLAVMGRLARAWAGSQWAELDTYLDWCDCINTPEQRSFQRRLVDERNLVLARRVQAIHDAGHSVFVAVGSLHMIGPQGLPALLAARGFKVEAVIPAPRPAASPAPAGG
jgi:uncharacterized protein YbaP (TraB family)